MFFSTVGVQVKRCLEPSQVCTDSAIRAHSVQNATAMQLLQRDGHVKALAPDLGAEPPFPNWRDVGRNHATTFEGFCDKHDAALFAPIDTRPFDATDQEQLFLHAYRAVARELHTQMQVAVRTQWLYQQRVEAGIDKGNEPEAAGMMAVEQMMAAYFTYEYKSVLDLALLNRDFKILTHEILRLSAQVPAIAASVCFNPNTRQYQDDWPQVALNILPISHEETVVTFSFTDKDAVPVREYISETLASSGEYQKYLVSRLLLLHGENFVVAPTLFDTWSEAKREAIRDFFVRTARDGSADQSKDFYLL